jgi:hypothetical protein
MSILLKGALIEFMPTFLIPLPNVILFQYNPETMTHTWSQPQPVSGGSGGSGGGGGSDGATTGPNPLAVQGQPGETFGFTLSMDSNDDIANGNPVTGAIAEVSGVYSRIAALEMLLYPSGSTTGGLLGMVSALGSAGSMLGGGPSGVTTALPQSTMPVVLFIWGIGRIVPVRVTALTITEKIFDAALNPVHAEAQITLRVLTPTELVAAQSTGDVLANLASIAYTYTFTLRQALAVANLANAASSIIGMIPH